MTRRRPDLPFFPVLLVALLAACGRPAVIAPVPSAPRPVQLGPAEVTALAELLRMEDARSLDTMLVMRHMSSSMSEVRARAVLAAGRIGDTGAAPLLRRALDDSVSYVRTAAAFALGELGDSASATISALSITALRDQGAPAAEAVAALGRLAAQSGRPTIDTLLAREGVDTPLLQEALLAAWRLPPDDVTRRHVARWAGDVDPDTRWRAAYALARAPSAAALPVLLAGADDPDHRVRSYSIRALRAPLADSAGVRERALTTLLAAVRDPHPHVRINAVNLLPGYQENARTTPLLVGALADGDPNVAVAAAQALGQSRDAAAGAALRRAAASVATDGLRTTALHALMRVDAADGADLALAWVDSSRWLLRMHAARALARSIPAVAAPALRELARDDHYLVAAEALGAVRALADSVPDARRIFIDRLGTPHPLVRAAAVRGLAGAATSADLDLLLQAYDRARQDTVNDAALAVVHALARIRRSGVPVERAFYLRFGTAGPPRDPSVHRALIDSIGPTPPGWADPAEDIPVRPLAFYEDIITTWVAPVLAGRELPRAVIGTRHGEIALELASADAPLTVHNFVSLVERGYYRGTRWHRVVPNFVIQDGDPRGDGSGGPGYDIRDEINPLRYMRGTLGMALAGPDTGGSQFFITHSPQPHLDGGYTVFGQVVDGMSVVDQVVQEDPVLTIRIIR